MFRVLCVLLLLIVQENFSFASVTIDRTRLIYDGSENVTTLTLNNNNNESSLIQLWVDNGQLDTSPSKIDVPFIISPQIKKLNSNQSQVVKVRYIGDKTYDGEKLYWLNMLEVPKKGKSGTNFIQLAYRTRIKFFYRPANLKELSQAESSENLQFKVDGNILKIKNESPFHITISRLYLFIDKNNRSETPYEYDGFMIAPNSSKKITVDNISLYRHLKYTYINDWGGEQEVKITL
ncbi:molecular chaperone [Vibrio parahaemolyticus]|uniref:fimbrial biogenesis chaperone n=1 Tax=Vibrio parahaemolyticus TaxID=670 RepID=UPI00100E7C78|nr:molecular chaperone [Vibrio parahaemolyticus]RXP52447.1 molecular chaperone [Vibrio parahaemolyticus]RXP52720.1 molecular chaperone [Vibrio parahaemolyticus]RXP65371.1 molecular chaperone [Vibrio parahaemolyticus]RXP70698.1 molecular chaperone [Vibrio parahaemolyticus]RXP92316.1 molecular chaperone [Vibrio parahaemolyticus]